MLSMRVDMEEDGLGQRMTKRFGPFGIVLDVGYTPG